MLHDFVIWCIIFKRSQAIVQLFLFQRRAWPAEDVSCKNVAHIISQLGFYMDFCCWIIVGFTWVSYTFVSNMRFPPQIGSWQLRVLTIFCVLRICVEVVCLYKGPVPQRIQVSLEYLCLQGQTRTNAMDRIGGLSSVTTPCGVNQITIYRHGVGMVLFGLGCQTIPSSLVFDLYFESQCARWSQTCVFGVINLANPKQFQFEWSRSLSDLSFELSCCRGHSQRQPPKACGIRNESNQAWVLMYVKRHPHKVPRGVVSSIPSACACEVTLLSLEALRRLTLQAMWRCRQTT